MISYAALSTVEFGLFCGAGSTLGKIGIVTALPASLFRQISFHHHHLCLPQHASSPSPFIYFGGSSCPPPSLIFSFLSAQRVLRVQPTLSCHVMLRMFIRCAGKYAG